MFMKLKAEGHAVNTGGNRANQAINRQLGVGGRRYSGQRARTNALAAFSQLRGRGPNASNPRVQG